MHLHDQIPVELAHLVEGYVAEDSSVVDDDVDGAERVHGSLDDLVTKFDGIIVSDGCATVLLDLSDNEVGRRRCLALLVLALQRLAEVVDDDFGAARP